MADAVSTEASILERIGKGGPVRDPVKQALRDVVRTLFNRTGLFVSARTADFTIALTDDRAYIEVNSATDITVTIPTNATVAFEAGTEICFVQVGAGAVILAAATGVTLATTWSLRTNGIGAEIKIKQSATLDTWRVSGDLSLARALDGFASVHSAYGLRALLSSYSGPLIKVRRASDDVLLDIYPDRWGNLDLNTIATFGTGTTLSVHTMFDQSGNSRDMAQTTDANQPAYSATGLGGKPAVGFTAASSHYLVRTISSDSIYADVNHMVNFVLDAPNQNFGGVFAESSTSDNDTQYTIESDGTGSPANQDLAMFIRMDNAALPINHADFDLVAFDDDPHTVSIRDANGTLDATVDSVAGTQLSYTRGTLTATTAALGTWPKATPVNFFSGSIAEVALFSAIPSAAERSFLESDQMRYYGIS